VTETPDYLDDSAFSVQMLQDLGLCCPLCNHNLSGATDMRCGECGVEVELRVQLACVTEARWYLSLLLGLCGLNALSLVMLIVAIAARFKSSVWLWNMMLFAVCCASLILWIRNRDPITADATRSHIRKWILLFFLLTTIVIATVAIEQGALV
jgi:hypothetical protein